MRRGGLLGLLLLCGCNSILEIDDVRLLSELETVHSTLYGSAQDDSIVSVALDADGNIYLTGVLRGSVTLGGNVLEATNEQDVFVASLAPNGSVRWARSFGSSGDDATVDATDAQVDDTISRIAVGSSSAIYFGGYADGEMTLDSFTVNKGLYAAKMGATGNVEWAQNVTEWSMGQPLSAGAGEFRSATLTPNGLLLSGASTSGPYNPDVDAEGCPGATCTTDAVVVALNSFDGSHQANVLFGTDGADVATDAAGDGTDIYVAGQYSGAPAGFFSAAEAGQTNLFVLKHRLGPPTAAPTGWLVSGDTAGQQLPHRLLLEGDELVAVGYAETTSTLGGQAVGDGGGFAARLALADGAVVVSQVFVADGARSELFDVARRSDGGYVVVGESEGLQLAGAFIAAEGGSDAIVLKLNTGLAPQSGRAIGGVGDDGARSVALADLDLAVVGANSSGGVDFGLGPLLGVGGTDVVIATLAP